MSAFRRRGLTCLLLATLAGCSNFNAAKLNPMNWFGAEKPKPAPLETITPKISARQVWSTKVDSVQFPLVPAVNGDTFTIAGTDGTVIALEAAGGRELWRAHAGDRLSAGVGSDGRFSAVVTRGNELVVLDGSNVKWRKRLNSRVTTPPLVAGERVFVMGVDRVVQAFDALDGRPLWALQRPSDALTLSATGVVVPFKDTLLVGQGPRLTAVDPLRGAVRWEVPVASPRGTNEVERLADLIGPPVRLGDIVCTRAFQSAVGCADAGRGTLLWSRNAGGITNLAGDEQVLVGADGSDRVTAWREASGDVAWSNERFLNRRLSGPISVGKAVLFGDFEGQLHFLSRDTGETLLRLPTDGSQVVGTPVRAGGTVLVATRNGGLFAFRLE
ncbi:MAG TPA: outer membrane protein assembly factor BamB [Burkholderiaceae bacterium]|nr:outer membrane protein assembly factor BamB [Burkholderiaceae bacterium]